jgi:hypothetical protein
MITIVSGLPRSGTSMMMQMLAAGGMPILGDTERRDESNPRGYYEWPDITMFPLYPKIIAQAEGKAVKLTSNFLCFLPPEFEYKIILMERPLAEVLASMEKMQRALHPEDMEAAKAMTAPEFRTALEALRREVFYWLKTGRRRNGTCAPHFWLHVYYHDILKHPKYIAEWISGAFMPGESAAGLDVPAMVRAVDPTLYRTRVEVTLPK